MTFRELEIYRNGRKKNNDGFVDLQMTNHEKLMPYDDLKRIVDLNELYKEECDKSSCYRLTLTIKPFCTNVLHNMCSEIVKNEDDYDHNTKRVFDNDDTIDFSDDSGVFGKKTDVTRVDMVNNTEYSKDKFGYKYKPGIDIFNNHYLRSNAFRVVREFYPDDRVDFYDTDLYNTLFDYMRDSDNKLIQYFPREGTSESEASGSTSVMRFKRLYNTRNVMTFDESVEKNLKEKDGWFGFFNKTSIETVGTPENDSVLNYVKRNDFVDMYPGREYYTFSPVFNESKMREEKNWEVLVTYPYEKFDLHPIVRNVIDEGVYGDVNALIVLDMFSFVTNENSKMLCFRSSVKHNLKKGDFVNLYYSCGSDIFAILSNEGSVNHGDNTPLYETDVLKYDRLVEVRGVGNENGLYGDYFFYINDFSFIDTLFSTCGERFILDNFYTEEVNTSIGTRTKVSLLNSVPTTVPDNGNTIIVYVKLTDSEINALGGVFWEEEDVLPSPTINMNEKTYVKVGDSYYEKKRFVYGKNGLMFDELLNYNLTQIRRGYSDDGNVFNLFTVRFSKNVNGVDSEYYFIKNLRLPNKNKAKDILTEEICKNKTDYEDMLEKSFSTDKGCIKPFKQEIYDLAFSSTIYNDKITQIEFTDDINTEYLVDYKGRPLTDIYATIIKKNNGFREWYNENMASEQSYDSVERSKCFGKLTSGVDILSIESDSNDVMRENKGVLSDVHIINNLGKYYAKSLEDYSDDTKDDGNINDYKQNLYFCNLVEYNKSKCIEEELSPVFYRFNTAQREFDTNLIEDDKMFFKFTYHELFGNEYDTGVEYLTNKSSDEDILCPEGYFYKSCYRIPINTFTGVRQFGYNNIGVTTTEVLSEDIMRVKVLCGKPHFLKENMFVFTCNDDNNEWTTFMVSRIVDDYCFVIDYHDFYYNDEYCSVFILSNLIKNKTLKLRIKNRVVPEYAEKIRNNTFLWRDLNKPSDETNPNKLPYPFMNGCFYIDKSINFYLRRQDPNMVNGLFFEANNFSFLVTGETKTDTDYDVYIKEEEMKC